MRLLLICLLLVFNFNICWAGIDFDGVNDDVNGTDAFYSNSMSISAWIYIKGMPASGNIKGIVVKRSAGNEWILQLNYKDANTCYLNFFAWSAGGSFNVNSIDAMALNTWYHVASRCDGTDADVLINAIERDGSQSGQVIQDTASIIELGNSANVAARYFNGIITEVAIWNTYLTDAEIALLYNSRIKGMPLQIQPANLMIYMPMDDQETATSADGDMVRDMTGLMNGTGVDGADDTGLLWVGETILSYPPKIGMWE